LPAAIASGTFRADLFTVEYFPNPRAAFAEPEGRHSDAGRVIREALRGEGAKENHQDR
jgi:hypothetical protein